MSGPPLLGPDSVSWRVNAEPAVLMGGGRALLLQVAHPLVAAGVEQHSNYAAHPWRRLFHTLDTTVKIVFGDGDTSATASSGLRRRHDFVKGESEDGVAYDAQDPDLLLWVWATLVDTSLVVYERCFGPLGEDDRERFYEEQKLFAYACGTPEGHCPASFADFAAYVERVVAEELRVTEAARAVAQSIVRPPVPRPLRPIFSPNTLVTAGLLPPRIREEYGFRWSPRRQRLLNTWFAAVRGGTRLIPRRAREFPVRRVAAARPLARRGDDRSTNDRVAA